MTSLIKDIPREEISEKESILLTYLSKNLKAIDLGQISAETGMLPHQVMKLLESLSEQGLVVIRRNDPDAISGVLVAATGRHRSYSRLKKR